MHILDPPFHILDLTLEKTVPTYIKIDCDLVSGRYVILIRQI